MIIKALELKMQMVARLSLDHHYYYQWLRLESQSVTLTAKNAVALAVPILNRRDPFAMNREDPPPSFQDCKIKMPR